MKLRMTIGTLMLILAGTFAALAATPDDKLANTVCAQAGWHGTYLTPVSTGEDPDVKHFYESVQFGQGGSISFAGSYFPELMLTDGTTTEGVGNWRCLKDGRIAATLLFAAYSGDGSNLSLIYHARASMVFSFLNSNTIRRDTLVVRLYWSYMDPTDPDDGFIVNLPESHPVYTKVGIRMSELGL